MVVCLLFESRRYGAERRLPEEKEAALENSIAILALALLLAMAVIDRLAR